MESSEIVQIVVAILGSGSIIFIIIQYQLQKLQNLEEKLRSERRKIYLDVLKPLIYLFKKQSKDDELFRLIDDVDYRISTVDLALIGSDDVIRAWGDFMQHLYTGDKKMPEEQAKMMNVKLLARLLLTIRKDFGNRKTKLKEYDMLRHMITDLERYSRDEINSDAQWRTHSAKNEEMTIPTIPSKGDQNALAKIQEMNVWMEPIATAIGDSATSGDRPKLGHHAALMRTYLDQNIPLMESLTGSTTLARAAVMEYIAYLKETRTSADLAVQAVDKYNSGDIEGNTRLMLEGSGSIQIAAIHLKKFNELFRRK